MGEAAAAAAGDLAALLSSNEPLVRMEAAITLISVNPKGDDPAVKKAVPIVVSAFVLRPEEDRYGQRWPGRCDRAREALVKLGKPAVHELMDAILPAGDFSKPKPNNLARIEVYRTLEKLGVAAYPELNKIRDMMNNEDPAVKKAANEAYNQIRNAR
jgi:hypothetical protein